MLLHKKTYPEWLLEFKINLLVLEGEPLHKTTQVIGKLAHPLDANQEVWSNIKMARKITEEMKMNDQSNEET
jgi:hypothetical protein